ncbi:acyl-CoA dehydrogenase family protein [Sphingomicrobium lutaoense]|uniref:Alkylation response protein AidB-like acyl-CoA dehydrogenase n=1 Tax=Sphingomicrobium lutaoense TaxID=515949 RepID=A0A839YT61_9SPHN|nr:acyl-CoA dehydrogenase family protein [Sphingomicrobium lutaoense]MBB3763461.1 alkylation response protein AidB-like acyl-CoA dehydrogenase [Sphingomicrobium lutaoense]
MIPERPLYDDEQQAFRASVRRFIAEEIAPHTARHEAEGQVERALWRKAGAIGMLCPQVPDAYGGLGMDFRANALIGEELGWAGAQAGFTLQSDIVADYLVHYGSEEQKKRYLPAMVEGRTISAIAMTEPGTGSDLQAITTRAVREGNGWRLSGAKTYITNGAMADLVIVAAKTGDGEGARSLSLFLVEEGDAGFTRGKRLDKIGLKGNDTSELFFEEVRLPADRLLGAENGGFSMLMDQLPQERLSIAVNAQAAAQRAYDEALAFTSERQAFGKPVAAFQATRFRLAEMKTRLQVGWAHLDWAIARHVEGALSPGEASAAKLWHSEMLGELADEALQLHGGAGYMNEYPIARLWRDARVTRIYGGTSEIMKEMVAREVGDGS